ncbi:MAG: class I SAM-dependent methyltransferase [Acidobacteriota bacterium]
MGMDNGWDASADAWIADQGDRGDFGRRYVLDPVMLPRALARQPTKAIDIGCGEGRFCRVLAEHGVPIVGVDPTLALIATARERDPRGHYVRSLAEHLPFGDQAFDLVVSYLTFIDIPDIATAIPEMARVLRPGGALLVANLNSFNTAAGKDGWVKDGEGRRAHYAIDHYLDERADWIEYRGIRIVNHHRPMSTYFKALHSAGLTMTYFDEPRPSSATPAPQAASYSRMPWFHAMEWVKL